MTLLDNFGDSKGRHNRRDKEKAEGVKVPHLYLCDMPGTTQSLCWWGGVRGASGDN